MLYHEFLLLDRSTHHPSEYLRHIHLPGAIRLHDDVFGYLLDTLDWVPSASPADRKPVRRQGLHRYGPTLIEEDGAKLLQRIFQGWANMFALGPEPVRLRGAFELHSMTYEALVLPRQQLVDSLNEIAALAPAVTARNYLLHLGI